MRRAYLFAALLLISAMVGATLIRSSQPTVRLQPAAASPVLSGNLTVPITIGSHCTARLTAGSPVCLTAQPSVLLGLYVDDTTPHLDYWLSIAVKDYPLVVRAVGPGSPRPKDCSWPHVLCAKEWYPYESGSSPKSWGKIPRYRAYIIQHLFSLTGRRVKPWQTAKLLREVRRFHPRLVLEY